MCWCLQNQSNEVLDDFENLFLRIKKESFDDDEVLEYLEIALNSQDTVDKEVMKSFLEEIEKEINFQYNNRIVFIYLLLKARNQLAYHNYSETILKGNEALAMKNFTKANETIYLLSTLGTAHYFKSEYQDALKYHFDALKICESMESNKCSAEIFNNIAVVYMGFMDWDKAERYTIDALKNAESNVNSFEKSRAMGNMAIVFAEKGDFTRAEEWFIKDLEFDLKQGDSLSGAKNFNNLGRLYDIQDFDKKALEYYLKGLEIAVLQNDAASVALGYQNVGWILSKLGRNDEAITNFQKGMEMTRNLGNRDKLRDAYFNISEFYYELNQPKKSLEYFLKYHDLNDSLIGEKTSNAISELEIKYETQKKENEILSLSKQKLKDEIALERNQKSIRRLSFGLVGGFILVVFSFLLFRQHSKNRRQKELLNAISETQLQEQKRIAQDLHDSVGGSLAMTKNKLEDLLGNNARNASEMMPLLETLSETGDQIRRISHNMMPSELLKFGLVPAVQSLLEQVNNDNLNTELYTHQVDEYINQTKALNIYRIIQEAAQNTLKHAKAKIFTVNINQHKDYLSLLLEDDGKGFKTSEKIDGMGLQNIRNRVKLLNGSINISSNQGYGTSLDIKIPLA